MSHHHRDVFIVAPKRSAVGKAPRGSLRTTRPDDLGAAVMKAVLQEAGEFDHATIDDVIFGCAMPEAEQGMNVARLSLLLAGMPNSVPGVTINRFCSSGLQSIAMAADAIRAGSAECILAGGTESMSMVPMMGNKVVAARSIMGEHPEFYLSMGLTAENVAQQFKISREDQDQFAFESHHKACHAIEKGHFKNEIVPIAIQSRKPGFSGGVDVQTTTFSVDEGPRADSTAAALGKLKPVFLTGGTVTAGNSSQMSDGAAACLVVSEEYLKTHQLSPIARFCSYRVSGVDPKIMGIGPVTAIPKALDAAGVSLSQVERIELNEAFAAQALAVMRSLDVNPEIVNPTGGAIALGHPLGTTGAKLTATLLHGLHRDNQRYGIVSMCIGTGMGAAGVFEKV